jgi:DNA-binding MarR family transcriptional regulator
MSAGRERPEILDPEDRTLWRDFLSWSQSVLAAVGRDLDDQAGLSIPDLEVLGRLWDSGGELEQQRLVTWLRWSPSRLSHHLDRMTRRGLVRRTPAGSGRRMTVAITDQGEQLALAAFAKLSASIRRHFLDTLSTEERAVLRAITSRD